MRRRDRNRSSVSASPGTKRTGPSISGFCTIRMWVVTSPPFCARPIWSMTDTPRPSRWAAMPRIAPIVTIPVPPIPPTSRLAGREKSILGAGASGGLRVGCRRPARNAALDGDETRTESIDAGRILIATRLVDRPLAAELGFQRNDRDAVRLPAAIAAPLAHRFVDHDAPAGIGQLTALAAAALFGGANLIVDQDRDALRLAQRELNGFQAIARIDGHARRHVLAAMALGHPPRRCESRGRPRRQAGARSGRRRSRLPPFGRRSWPPRHCRESCR